MPSSDEHVPEDHLPLHPLEFQVLLALTGGPTHAYAIVRSIEERQPAWSRILPTNLYRRIWRLASAELIEEVDGADAASDRPRRYFSITRLGRQVAAAETGRLRSLLVQAEQAGVAPSGGAIS